MKFIAILVREDNLMYFFYNDKKAFSVDSFDSEAIIHALSCDFDKTLYTAEEIMNIKQNRKKRDLVYALTTHSHYDHAGGNANLKKLSPTTEFLQNDNFENLKTVQIEGTEITCIKTPCHTKCSVCFYVRIENLNYLLTGDFIFKLGCGKFFEGNSRDFLNSLNLILKICPDDTVLLYGHDYYKTNRKFAEKYLKIENCENYFLTLREEKKYNPFINYEAVEIQGSPEEKIAILREEKNNFKSF